MTEFKVIETQEQLDTIIKARLDREKSKYADYDSLAEKIKNLETENLNLKEGKAKFLLRFVCSCKQKIFKHNLDK